MAAQDYASKERLILLKHRLETALQSTGYDVDYWANLFKSEPNIRREASVITQRVHGLEKAELKQKQIREHLDLVIQALSEWESTNLPQTASSLPSETRESFINRLLDEKGWSILDWAKEAEVSYHTANGYLKGNKKPFKNTRVKLAKSLGIDIADLPE